MSLDKRFPFIPRFGRLGAGIGLSLSLLAGTLSAPQAAQAEGQIRIAEQFGIVYLLLNVVRDQQLIEKHGKADGLDIDVDWQQLSGGAAINDALLSGAIDVAGAGIGPLLTVWDRTHGRQNVRGVASLGNFPYYLVSNNPKVKTVADFTEKDRIALPAVGVSVQARFLQYAAAKQWGDDQFNRLDKYTVALPHPDATASLKSGGTELTGHFSNPPFQDQALQNPTCTWCWTPMSCSGRTRPPCSTPPRNSARKTPRPIRPSSPRWPKRPSTRRTTRARRPTPISASPVPRSAATSC